jgi:hypothetical protein
LILQVVPCLNLDVLPFEPCIKCILFIWCFAWLFYLWTPTAAGNERI